MTDVKNPDLAKIIKRLELIKSLIALEEDAEISTHVSKLEQNDLLPELRSIISYLSEKYYSKAVIAIEEFINRNHLLTVYLDPEVDAIKFEIKSLEAAINDLSDEKADLEKLIHEFGIRHNNELGELIIKILQYRKEKAKGTEQQQETEEDYNTYNKQYEASKNEAIETLTDEEQKELKNKYRKASKLCHPDVVSDEQKELATKLFAELNAAYEKNDLKRVSEILENLEKGHFFINKSDAISEKQLLQAEIKKLRLLVRELKEQVRGIKESNTYTTICNIDNWDQYFSNAKQNLQRQLNGFENGK
ncbi:J domain-containing protein [Ferruginibacter sp.]|nr:DnaJ domain-containing protein [Ferruginibacter sp.]